MAPYNITSVEHDDLFCDEEDTQVPQHRPMMSPGGNIEAMLCRTLKHLWNIPQSDHLDIYDRRVLFSDEMSHVASMIGVCHELRQLWPAFDLRQRLIRRGDLLSAAP